jgi:preprotein translocase subunit YajC
MYENLLLQAAEPGGGLPFFIAMMGVLLVFYIFMIRPQTKKQKEQTSFMDSLQRGTEVVTASGIIGKINKIEGNIVTLEVGTKTYIRMTRSAISKEMTESHLGGTGEVEAE